MKIEVAVIEHKEMDLVEALTNHLIAWDYDLVTGTWAEHWYPAERDDMFLEISQELVNTYDGSTDSYRLCWLECADFIPELMELKGSVAKRAVLDYLRNNIHRAIDVNKTGGHW